MPSSFVRIRRDDVETWYHLSKGPRHWALRDLLNGDGTPCYYQRELADFPGTVMEKLTLVEVEERTSVAVRQLSTRNPDHLMQWRRAFTQLTQGVRRPDDPSPSPPSQASFLQKDEEGHRPFEGQRSAIPVTELQGLYSVLTDFSERKFQLAIAQEASRTPVVERLAQRFRTSVEQFSRFGNVDEHFYPQVRENLHQIGLCDPINSTTDLTAMLQQHCGNQGIVVNDATLDFTFVDREIIPSRTTSKARFLSGESANRGKRLDWLLKNADGTMIVAEVKVATDKNSFFALIQCLMYAAELVTDSQQKRMAQWYNGTFRFPDLNDKGDPSAPVCDIYLVLHRYNFDDDLLSKLFQCTRQVSRKLMEHEAVSGYIRRIACLEARRTESGQLVFHKLFAYGHPS